MTNLMKSPCGVDSAVACSSSLLCLFSQGAEVLAGPLNSSRPGCALLREPLKPRVKVVKFGP